MRNKEPWTLGMFSFALFWGDTNQFRAQLDLVQWKVSLPVSRGWMRGSLRSLPNHLWFYGSYLSEGQRWEQWAEKEHLLIITNITHKKKLLFSPQFCFCLLYFWSSHAFSISHLHSSPALMEDVAGKLPFHHSSKWWDVRKEDNYTILNSCLSEEAAEERGNLLLHSNIYFSRFVSTTVF